MILDDIRETLDNILEENGLDTAAFVLGDNGVLELTLTKDDKVRVITYEGQYLEQTLEDNEVDLFNFMDSNKEYWKVE